MCVCVYNHHHATVCFLNSLSGTNTPSHDDKKDTSGRKWCNHLKWEYLYTVVLGVPSSIFTHRDFTSTASFHSRFRTDSGFSCLLPYRLNEEHQLHLFYYLWNWGRVNDYVVLLLLLLITTLTLVITTLKVLNCQFGL